MTRARQEPRMRARPDHRLPPSAFLSSIFSLPHTVQLRLLSVVLARDTRSWLRGIPRKRPGLHTRSVSVSSPTTSSTDYPPACSPTMVSSGVIGALSTVQKDHRKHAVHMATLRAHGMSGPAWYQCSAKTEPRWSRWFASLLTVRKMADARKDKMGPQWSQWVTKTVQRLVCLRRASRLVTPHR